MLVSTVIIIDDRSQVAVVGANHTAEPPDLVVEASLLTTDIAQPLPSTAAAWQLAIRSVAAAAAVRSRGPIEGFSSALLPLLPPFQLLLLLLLLPLVHLVLLVLLVLLVVVVLSLLVIVLLILLRCAR